MLQGWCVQSSDPRTLGMNSVPKEVIPGQVNFSNLTLCSPSWKKNKASSSCFVQTVQLPAKRLIYLPLLNVI